MRLEDYFCELAVLFLKEKSSFQNELVASMGFVAYISFREVRLF